MLFFKFEFRLQYIVVECFHDLLVLRWDETNDTNFHQVFLEE